MKKTFAKTFSMIACLSVLSLASVSTFAAAAGAAMPMCKDGTTSVKAGKGACAHHGGVQKAEAAAGSTAPKTAAPKAAATGAGATASTSPIKCKDGTMSKAKTHKGACSKHGGISE